MQYSQMSPEQRRRLLADPENYPLRLSFLGKRGLLSYEEVAFLLRKVVDFDVDDRQFGEILAKQEEVQPPEMDEDTVQVSEASRTSDLVWAGHFVALVLAVFGGFALLRRWSRARGRSRRL